MVLLAWPNCPTADAIRMKSFSMVSLIPLFAVETLEPQEMERLPEFRRSAAVAASSIAKIWPHLVAEWKLPGVGERRLAGADARPSHEARAGAHAR